MNRLTAKMYLNKVLKNKVNFKCETEISFLNQTEVPATFKECLKRCSKILINLNKFDTFNKVIKLSKNKFILFSKEKNNYYIYVFED